MLLSNLMLESEQVRHFSQWDLQSLEYFRHLPNPQASPSGFYTSVFCIYNIIILNPVDPLASVSNLYYFIIKLSEQAYINFDHDLAIHDHWLDSTLTVRS